MRIVVLDGHTLNPGDNPWDDLAAARRADRARPHAAGAGGRARRRSGDRAHQQDGARCRGASAQLSALRFIAVLATGYNVVDVAAARGARDAGVERAGVRQRRRRPAHAGAAARALPPRRRPRRARCTRANGRARPDFCFWLTPADARSRGRRWASSATAASAAGGAAGARPRHEACWPAAASRAPLRRRAARRLANDPRPLRRVPTSSACTARSPTDNAGFVNAALLARMQPGALLINTARGALIDEPALAAALDARAASPAPRSTCSRASRRRPTIRCCTRPTASSPPTSPGPAWPRAAA